MQQCSAAALAGWRHGSASSAHWLSRSAAALSAGGREVFGADMAAAADALLHGALKLRGALLHLRRRLLVQRVVWVGRLRVGGSSNGSMGAGWV